MSRLLEGYKAYCKKFDHIKKPTKLKADWKGLQEFKGELSKAKKISGSCKVYGCSNRSDGSYELPDGRIAEVFLNAMGFISFVYLFEDKKHHSEYREPMPFNIWAWG